MTDLWHSRGYLPHWEAGEVPQSITFRLADSLPSNVLDHWRDELKHLPDTDLERRIRIEHALDRGHGSSVLSNPKVADVVERAFLHFDAVRYRLHAWCIMPNHVHIVATPLADWTLSSITHSWKSFTASKVNEILNTKGAFWSPEYYDRAIRDDTHFEAALAYVAMNPVKANLCSCPEEWRFSSSWPGKR